MEAYCFVSLQSDLMNDIEFKQSDTLGTIIELVIRLNDWKRRRRRDLVIADISVIEGERGQTIKKK